MNKLILLLFLLIGNCCWAAASSSGDDEIGSTTAAKAPGEKPCACDARNASNTPVGEDSPETQKKRNEAQVATVEGKDVANPTDTTKATN